MTSKFAFPQTWIKILDLKRNRLGWACQVLRKTATKVLQLLLIK